MVIRIQISESSQQKKVNLWLKQHNSIPDQGILASVKHQNLLKIFRRKPE